MKPPEEKATCNMEAIIPPASVSKAGFMSEVTTGTRQLAKASLPTKAARKPRSGGSAFMPALGIELEEFGTGQALDQGRNKELLSSPREDVHASKRVCRRSPLATSPQHTPRDPRHR